MAEKINEYEIYEKLDELLRIMKQKKERNTKILLNKVYDTSQTIAEQ